MLLIEQKINPFRSNQMENGDDDDDAEINEREQSFGNSMQQQNRNQAASPKGSKMRQSLSKGMN